MAFKPLQPSKTIVSLNKYAMAQFIFLNICFLQIIQKANSINPTHFMTNTSFSKILLLSLLVLLSSSLNQQISSTNQMGSNDVIATQSNLIWPFSSSTTTDFPLSSTFGPRLQASNGYAFDFHRGIDIPRPNGTNLYAVDDALVFRDRVLNGDHYITLKIAHTTLAKSIQGYTYFYPTYRHLKSSFVVQGQTVSKGDLIAESGQSDSGFDHLHFDIAVGSSYEYRNTHPLLYLPYPNNDVPHVSKVDASLPYFHTSNKTVTFKVTVDSSELDVIEVSVVGTINNQNKEAIYNFKDQNLRHDTTALKALLDSSSQTLANGVDVEIGLIHHNAQNTIKTYFFYIDFSPVVGSPVTSYNLDITAKDVRDGYETVTIIGS